jgi:hypothetical protein
MKRAFSVFFQALFLHCFYYLCDLKYTLIHEFDFLVPSAYPKIDIVDNLESEFGHKLPPLYKIFLQCFEHGYEYFLRAKELIVRNPTNLPPGLSLSPFEYVNYGPIFLERSGEITVEYFNYFLNVEELTFSNITYPDEQYVKHELFIIGYFGHIGVGKLCIGYGKDNFGQIFGVMDEGNDEDPNFPFLLGKYADNIFDFVAHLKQGIDETTKDDVLPIYLTPPNL